MDATLITISVLSSVISLVLLFFIIKFANASEKRDKLLTTQVKLLAHIALKQGVSQETLNKVLGSKFAEDRLYNSE